MLHTELTFWEASCKIEAYKYSAAPRSGLTLPVFRALAVESSMPVSSPMPGASKPAVSAAGGPADASPRRCSASCAMHASIDISVHELAARAQQSNGQAAMGIYSLLHIADLRMQVDTQQCCTAHDIAESGQACACALQSD